MYPRLSINWNIRADGGGCIDWVLCTLMISFASIAGACFSSQLGRESALEHRISIRLIELEQAQSPIRCLAHIKVLAGGRNIAVTALKRVGVEERSASCRLESDAGHAQRYLRDVGRGGARLSLPGRRRGPSSLGLCV